MGLFENEDEKRSKLLEQIEEVSRANREKLPVTNPSEFNCTKYVGSIICLSDNAPVPGYDILQIDEDKRLLNFPEYKQTGGFFSSKTEVTNHIYPFDSLVDVELLDNGETKIDGNSLLGAAIGGIAFGGIGALIGANAPDKKLKEQCKNLSIKVTFNSFQEPVRYITLVAESGACGRNMKRDSFGFKMLYSFAQEVLSLLGIVLQQNKSAKQSQQLAASNSTSDTVEALKKLAELKECGVLTELEFQEKKKELLSKI